MFLDLDDVWQREGKWVLMNGPEKFLAGCDNMNKNEHDVAKAKKIHGELH